MSSPVVLYGRDAPLGSLRTALAGAIAGRGQLALVGGEAGMGKSAMARAVAREAEAAGAKVTWGRAWEFADAPPYFPVWPCLRALGLSLAEKGDETHDERYAYELWESVVASLARASSVAPLVWLLEDLHAADVATLDLLTFLAQPLRSMGVLVVATLRTKDPRVTERMTQRLTRMARDGLAVGLEPLSARDISALTEETLGRAVPEASLGRLTELTGGNPLFVVECARAFRAAGGIEGTLGVLPATVRQVVLDRVALLPESTRHALACGAILGREFSAASIARMDASLPARVIDALLPALRSGLVEERGPGEFIFSHTLVRDAIDDALPAAERREIHRRADEALAPLGGTVGVLIERARHALSALPSGDEAHVLDVAGRALELLEREGAFDRAFELHMRIGEARRSGLLPAQPPSAKLHVAEVARAAGRSDVGRRLCEEVVAEARAARDAELLARAALLHAADVRPGVVDRSQVSLLQEARAALGETSPELACRVLARLTTALQPAPDPAVLVVMARDALARARETGSDGVILEVLDVAAWGLYTAPLAERIAWSEELLERARGAGDLPRTLKAYEWLAFQHIETGDFDAFHRDAESMLALSDEIGHPRYRWRALLLASARAVMLGHFTESDRYVTEIDELATLTDDPALPFALAFHRVMRARMRRHDAEMRAACAKLGHLMDGMPHAVSMGATIRATCAARMEDALAARAESDALGAGARAVAYALAIAQLGEAYALSGTDDQRRWARDALSRTETAELSSTHMAFTYEGTAVRVLGLLDAALGDLAGGERRLLEAHTLAVERRHMPWVAQTAYELAKVVKQAGRPADAQRWMEECWRLARELGMTGLERSVSADAGPAPVVRSASLGLVREGEVWTVSRGGVVVRVRDSRGMQLLARLVGRPGEEIHVLALASDEAATAPESHAGELIDERARKTYRARVAELEVEIPDAERVSDKGRAARLRKEKEALERELARAVGLGGRARHAGSQTERARVNVQRRVKDAIARIADADEAMGRFLGSAVQTGTYCCFRP